MKQRVLGKDLKVSAVGLGCMGMSHAYGTAPDRNEMIRLLNEAVDVGYTFFDTAECYGLSDDPHHNEKLLGEAFDGKRDKVVIGTKFGLTFDYSAKETNLPVIADSHPETICKAVEGSLKRLRTDYIDIYYQHRQDPDVPVEEVAGVMADLIKEGKILHWGLSEVDETTIRRAHAVCPLTAIQNRYSMMARWHESVFPVLEELGIGYVAFSPMANGLLTTKYSSDTPFEKVVDYRSVMPQYQKGNFEKNRALIELVEKTAKEHNATPAQIAMAWMLCKKPYIVPIPGTRKKERLIENAGAADVVLTADKITSIDTALDNMDMSEVYGGTRVIK